MENIWHFISHEITTPENDERVKQPGLSSIERKDQVSQIGAQKVVVLIDARTSGAALVAFAARGLEDRKAMAQLARSTGPTSCGGLDEGSIRSRGQRPRDTASSPTPLGGVER